MNNFESFFRNLYSDKHATISDDKKEEFMNKADHINDNSSHPNVLNEPFTKSEVASAVKSLKTGKASSIDMINNEILKCFDGEHLQFLTNLFNLCFDSNLYPWNENILTPLHKMGNKCNPDNFRAIAVGSAIGKVFSNISLDRLIKFRKENCPDPPNQLGFTKGAQTYDHILTMQTIMHKYKKLHKPVYSVFVDFKKAFDSVCRQALFYKMAKLGITGKFYNTLKNMYSNSCAYIKLSGHLSEKIKTCKGTEQGHPLSPDLFKKILWDLSNLLDLENCPKLSETSISHLLWADDLIMLSLNMETCQKQLDILGKFCQEWGIEINEIKTKVMICGGNKINNSSCDSNFHLLGKPLKVTDTYCYLGIILHKSGELKTAQLSLKVKSMRAFMGLKRTVMRSKLSFKALTTLFDSLIKPIILYGAPIWTPTSVINKSIIKHLNSKPVDVKKFISKINRTNSEKVHLSFLKWSLGVHRKASNIGVWGETGRYPLIYQSIRLTLNYYKRLLSIPKNSFVFAALKEQKSLKLPWFKNIESLLKLDEIYNLDHVTAFRTIVSNKNDNSKNRESNSDNNLISKDESKISNIKPLPSKKFRTQRIFNILTDHFVKCWDHEKSNSSKLSFYNSCKQKFAREAYLDNSKGFSRRYNTTKIRISSHALEIESGRYIDTPRDLRICNWCKCSMGSDVVEDENHFLFECDLYASLRSKLITKLNNAPKIEQSTTSNTEFTLKIDNKNLRSNLMTLLSPHTSLSFNDSNTDAFNYHHKVLQNVNIKVITPIIESYIFRRSYITNCVCTFISRAYEKRQKYVNQMQEINARQNTIVINF